jgi:phenylacetate-CoA ligase
MSMNSLIEQAARRLEQLRQAGVELPETNGAAPPRPGPAPVNGAHPAASRDAGFIAHECPSGSLHICAEDLVVEILRADGQPAGAGELGEIVVTHMASADFPFVRYRTGDMGVRSQRPCACGRGLPVLADVQGKMNHFVVALNGAVLPAAALTYVLRELTEVQQYQIHQLSLERTVVQLVAPQLGQDSCSRIVQGFRARLGAGVRIDIERVDSIAPLPSGKHLFVHSEVDAFAHLEQGVARA